MKFTNNTNIPLGLAVWLLHDSYDHINEKNYISVTALMRPLKQTILASRILRTDTETDISEFTASSIGTAFHNSIEKSWSNGDHVKALAKLGYPTSLTERILVNPTALDLQKTNEPIAVYIEQRSFKQVGKWKLGGKFDMVMDGIIIDNKSTSAYSWLYGTRDEEHRLQLSLYRWLNQEIVTEDYGQINYIFTDWQKVSALSNPKYPQSRLLSKQLTLLSLAETEQWVKARFSAMDKYWNESEENIPECTDEELWRSEAKYKYYKDASKTDGRSTKNFDTLKEANAFKAEKGNLGIVKSIPGEVKRCGYCNAYDICIQKTKYFTEER